MQIYEVYSTKQNSDSPALAGFAVAKPILCVKYTKYIRRKSKVKVGALPRFTVAKRFD